MTALKTKKLKIITINYFEKVVDKKESEYFYLLKDNMFNIIFDVCLEKYNQDNFTIFE